MNDRLTARIGWGLLIVSLCLPIYVRPASAQMLKLTTQSEIAAQYFMMGMNDFDNVFTRRAAEHFAAAFDEDPDFALAYAMNAFVAPGLTADQRRAKMDIALGTIATTTMPELLLASALRRQLDGDAAGAKALFGAAEELVPDDPHVAFRHASFVGSPGSAERVVALKSITERFPDLAAAFNTLAYAQWAVGDKAGARQNVARYAELLPNHPNSHDSLAEIMQFSGRYSQAIEHYEKAISLDPNYFAGYTGLAEARLMGGDANGALASLQEAKKHAVSDQQRANVTRFVANAYFYDGDGAMGLRTLKEAAIEAEKGNATGLAAQIHRELAVAEALFGSTGTIPMHIKVATELAPVVANHVWAALAYGIARDADSARREARSFEKGSGGNDYTKVLDALAALAEGEHDTAETLLLSADLEDPWARAILARCRKESGHMAEAQAMENEILADHQFTMANLSYTLSRLILVQDGAGQVRSALGSR